MTSFKTGLIVGKFCPLHKGHQYLIETALKACERLVIISYAKPGYLGCETQKRRDWLEELYPETIRLVVDDNWLLDRGTSLFKCVPHDDADEETHRYFTAWLCHSVLGETADAIFTSEDYGDGFARAVSEYQRSPAKHICVDKARDVVPISGTKIRENPAHNRGYLSDVVFRSFIKKAVFLGGESTGKSSLAEMLAARLGTQYAPEYGREIWEQKKGQLSFEDLLHIAQTQIKREASLLPTSRDWLFCDTSPLTTLFYSDSMFGKTDPELEKLSQLTYDVTFLCAPDFEFVQDGTRQGAAFRERQHQWYLSALKQRAIDYVLLKGPMEERLNVVLNTLEIDPSLNRVVR
ncbi:MAG: AAA family ATPase [Hellea sp.]